MRLSSKSHSDVRGLRPSEPFVIVGDQNADPFDGYSVAAEVNQLLDSR